eukprot:scaffold303282_cov27-Tisochrysis_lutea.AAC.1
MVAAEPVRDVRPGWPVEGASDLVYWAMTSGESERERALSPRIFSLSIPSPSASRGIPRKARALRLWKTLCSSASSDCSTGVVAPFTQMGDSGVWGTELLTASASACALSSVSAGFAERSAKPHVASATPTPKQAMWSYVIAPNSLKNIPPEMVVNTISSAW